MPTFNDIKNRGTNYVSKPQITAVEDIVYSKMDSISKWAAEANDTARTAIDSIGLIDVPTVSIQFPEYSNIDTITSPDTSEVPNAKLKYDGSTVSTVVDGNVDLQIAPATVNQPVYYTPIIASSRPRLHIPTPPVDYPTANVNSAVPTIDSISAPDGPSFKIDDTPNVTYMEIPKFTPKEITMFNDAIPGDSQYKNIINSNTDAIQQLINRAKGIIHTDILNGGITQFLNDMNSLITDLDIANIETDANRIELLDIQSKTNIKTNKAIYAAQDKYASNNFSIPPGSLVKEISDILLDSAREMTAQSVKLPSKHADIIKKDFESKVRSLYVLEELAVNTSIEAAKSKLKIDMMMVKSNMEAFNSLVSIYESKLKSVQLRTSTIGPAIDTAIEQNDWIDTAVKAEASNIAVDTAKVQMLRSQFKTIDANASVLKSKINADSLEVERQSTELKGYKDNIQNILANMQSYKDAINNYSKYVKLQNEDISTYISEVEASSSGNSVLEGNIKSYAAHNNYMASADKANASLSISKSEVLNDKLTEYKSRVSVNEENIKNIATQIKEQASIESERVRSYEKQLRSVSKYNRASQAVSSAALLHASVSAENAARAESLANQAQAETDTINVGALAAKAKALSAMAQGAMSALSVRATAGASGSLSAAFSASKGFNSSWGGSTSRSERVSEEV